MVASLSVSNKIKQKEGITILLISKNECFQLQKYGHKFGFYGTLHKSKSRNPKYYLTESKKALNDLQKIRKSHVVDDVTTTVSED